MSKLFKPYGPFELPFKDGSITDEKKNEFWGAVEGAEPGLSTGIGCYIFAIRAGKGILPWYVGKTEKQGFKKECWQDSKLRIYERGLKGRKGTPLLYLIARHTNVGSRFKRKSINSVQSVKKLEQFLIGTCLLRNSRLLNKSDVQYFRDIVVPGYMNEPRGARTAGAKELAHLLGVRKIANSL